MVSLLQLKGVSCKLLGSIARYFLILKDNYFGNWVHFVTLEEYRQRRQNPNEHLEMKRRENEAKVLGIYHVFITMDHHTHFHLIVCSRCKILLRYTSNLWWKKLRCCCQKTCMIAPSPHNLSSKNFNLNFAIWICIWVSN